MTRKIAEHPVRLLDDPALDPATIRARELLARMMPPSALDAGARARIEGSLAIRAGIVAERRPLLGKLTAPLFAGVVAATCVSVVTIVWLQTSASDHGATVSNTAPPSSAAAPSLSTAPASAPSEIQPKPVAPPSRTVLKEGRWSAKAHHSPVELEAGPVIVRVPLGAAVEVEVWSVNGVKVAAFGKGVTTRFIGGSDWLAVPDGSTWSTGWDQREADTVVVNRPRGSRPKTRASTAAAEPSPSSLAAESEQLGLALRKLRRNKDASGALVDLDAYADSFPRGALRQEERKARVEALLTLGRTEDALRVLEPMPIGRAARDGELLVVRGELRAEAKRCGDAVVDFTAFLARGATGSFAERALFGRALCRLQLGQRDAATSDLRTYLHRHPNGKRSARVTRLLGEVNTNLSSPTPQPE